MRLRRWPGYSHGPLMTALVSLPGLGCEGTCTGPLWCHADFNHASVAFLPPVEIGEGFEAYQLIKHDHNDLEP